MTTKIAAILFLVIFTVAFALACDSDEIGTTTLPVDEPDPLKEKDGTLFVLELLFNEYNATEYDRLLDNDFVFFFSDADFRNGKTPEQWAREVETRSYNNFFDPNRANDRVLSRSLKLTYPADNWTEIDPPDPAQYPGEKWYVKTIVYGMSVVIDVVPELIYIGNGMKAEFTIRWDDKKGHYRLILWRDDVTGGFRSILAKNAATEETTWGSIKALYQ